MPRYDPFGHFLLSSAAARLSSDALAAEADTAELLLRRGSTLLADTEFTVGTSEHDRAVLAVVHQVNWQVERGITGSVYKNFRRGDRGGEFKPGDMSPVAEAILVKLIPLEVSSADWPIAGSLR